MKIKTMTRQEQRQAKADKLAAKARAKEAKRQDQIDEKAWNKMVMMLKIKGAWIPEPGTDLFGNVIDPNEVAEGRAERDREIQREVELDQKTDLEN